MPQRVSGSSARMTIPCTWLRHDNECVEINATVMRWQVVPCLLYNYAGFVQSHVVVDDFTEKHDAIVRAHGDEIRAGPRIIIGRQTQGAAARTRVVGHLMLKATPQDILQPGCWSEKARFATGV